MTGIFRYNILDNVWEQLGENIFIDVSSAGFSVSLSADGHIVSIGSADSVLNIFEYVTEINQWQQRGDSILGEDNGDQSGFSAQLSADGNMVVVGAWRNSASARQSGQTRIFQYLLSLIHI